MKNWLPPCLIDFACLLVAIGSRPTVIPNQGTVSSAPQQSCVLMAQNPGSTLQLHWFVGEWVWQKGKWNSKNVCQQVHWTNSYWIDRVLYYCSFPPKNSPRAGCGELYEYLDFYAFAFGWTSACSGVICARTSVHWVHVLAGKSKQKHNFSICCTLTTSLIPDIQYSVVER